MSDTRLCACGCGQPAPLAKRSNARRGHVRGQPLRYVNGHNRRGTTDLTRYTIDASGCWNWTGAINRKGYGRVQVAGEHTPAYRAMWEAAHGVTLPQDVQLDHLCCNPRCVNPAHLQPVTAAVNNRRKRSCKLTASRAAQVRAASGSHSAIGRAFGISRQLVGDVKSGRRWGAAHEAVS